VSYTEPTAILDQANDLLMCVSAELAALDAGAPARSFVAPGAEIAWDDCQCGQLTVHVLRAYPSDSFPILKQDGPFTRCAPKLTVVEFVVTILRCVTVQGDQGQAPPAAKLAEDAITDQLDRAAVRRGVVCCLTADNPLLQRSYLIQEQLAVGSEGECMGSELHLFVGLPNCRDC
jgi:hypothetical protein